MYSLNLIPVGFKQSDWTGLIKNQLSDVTGLEVNLKKLDYDLSGFYVPERDQCNASEILKDLEKIHLVQKSLILTNQDIYIPIFTYVFGLAKLYGNTAIVSDCRLTNLFYGLPPDDSLHLARIQKEVTHETGHMFGLKHCEDYRCVMHSSVTIDDLDVKQEMFCEVCKKIFE